MSFNSPVFIGSRGFHLYVNEFKGEPKINIRKHFQDKETGEVYPLKQGIALSLQEWEDVLSNHKAIGAELQRLAQFASYNNGKHCSRQTVDHEVETKWPRYQPYCRRAPPKRALKEKSLLFGNSAPTAEPRETPLSHGMQHQHKQTYENNRNIGYAQNEDEKVLENDIRTFTYQDAIDDNFCFELLQGLQKLAN